MLQYAERIWQIHEGSEDERIDQAIESARGLFERMDIVTRLTDYELGAEAIDTVIAQLEVHGMTQLGEHRDVTSAASRRNLEVAL